MYNNDDDNRITDTGPWKVFAIIGYVIGILSICFCWVIASWLWIGIPGIVFSTLGERSYGKRYYAKRGKTLSIIGIVLGAISTVIWIIVFIVAAGAGTAAVVNMSR